MDYELPSRKKLADAIRILSMDAVQKARSGHPGMPMGMADIAQVLWGDFMRHNPKNPEWCDRDRFILSNGHGSMLLYSLLHLTGYAVTLDDLKSFRQLHSPAAGHPEYGLSPGVETTTGPLGQGLAHAVGMAITESALAACFNRPGHDVVNHRTYVFAGDGCLMEGVSHESCSLAGVLGLGKLTVFYDDNSVSIDGNVTDWFREDIPKRFAAYGWHVIPEVDGHDPLAVFDAVAASVSEKHRPSIICCRTTIGFGSPGKAGSASAHGAPLGEEEVMLSRQQLEWEYPPFVVPEAIYAAWNAKKSGALVEERWNKIFADYEQAYPELSKEFREQVVENRLPDLSALWAKLGVFFQQHNEPLATRKASQKVLTELMDACPQLLIGGSADLAESNGTLVKNRAVIGTSSPGGNYIHFGVREFAMCAVAAGIALHRGRLPFVATFLVFSDYARSALRMAALMRQQIIFLFSHDSIALGEDGPTHQPVEQLSSLRLIPNFHVWRPADARETVAAWRSALASTDTPSAIALTRQSLPALRRTSVDGSYDTIRRGGYIVCRQSPSELDVVIIATGSEVHLAVKTLDRLVESGYFGQVVSMPCCELFDAQDEEYRVKVLPRGVPRLIIEAGSTAWWHRYIEQYGDVLGIDAFGASAPGEEVMKHFHFDAEHAFDMAVQLIASANAETPDVVR